MSRRPLKESINLAPPEGKELLDIQFSFYILYYGVTQAITPLTTRRESTNTKGSQPVSSSSLLTLFPSEGCIVDVYAGILWLRKTDVMVKSRFTLAVNQTMNAARFGEYLIESGKPVKMETLN